MGSVRGVVGDPKDRIVRGGEGYDHVRQLENSKVQRDFRIQRCRFSWLQWNSLNHKYNLQNVLLLTATSKSPESSDDFLLSALFRPLQRRSPAFTEVTVNILLASHLEEVLDALVPAVLGRDVEGSETIAALRLLNTVLRERSVEEILYN